MMPESANPSDHLQMKSQVLQGEAGQPDEQSTHVLEGDMPWTVNVSWTVDGSLKEYFIANGRWEFRLFLEPIGPGEDVVELANQVIQSTSAYHLDRFIHTVQIQPNAAPPGAYTLIATLTYQDNQGRSTYLSGVHTIGLIWLFEKAKKNLDQAADPAGKELITSFNIFEVGDDQPNRILPVSRDLVAKVKWELPGINVERLGGSLTAQVFFESIGPGEEINAGSQDVPIQSTLQTPSSGTLDVFIPKDKIPPEGVYSVVVILEHKDNTGHPTRIAGFATQDILRFVDFDETAEEQPHIPGYPPAEYPPSTEYPPTDQYPSIQYPYENFDFGIGNTQEPPELQLQRYVNLSLVSARDHANQLPATSSIVIGQAYDVRLNIGELLPESNVIEHIRETPFPVDKLPETEEGYWLEVLVTSDDFVVSTQRHAFFLPRFGPSWVCGCPPGEKHTCTARQRQAFLYIPVTAPVEPKTAQMRLGIYYQYNLIQSLLLISDIVPSTETPGGGHRARIDYTLSGKLADLSTFQPRHANILTNQSPDGSHWIIINGKTINDLSFHLAESQMKDTIESARETLRKIHYKKEGFLKVPHSLFDANNMKAKKDFITDLEILAQLGASLWNLLFTSKPALRKLLRQEILLNSSILQIARVGGSNFIFPWALIYDIPMENPDIKKTPCRLLDEWDGKSSIVPEGTTNCPHAAEHTKNTLCPFGFWGIKHVIEQPPSMPTGRDLPMVIRVGDRPLELLIGRNSGLDQATTGQHLAELRQRLQGYEVQDCVTVQTFAEKLANSELELVYFYCHGEYEPLPGGLMNLACLLLGKDEKILPGDIITWSDTDWPEGHWKNTSPLVFINGCHTSEILPESPVGFVDAFAGVYAAGVVGTEITVSQRVAGEIAERFFTYFAGGKNVGEAMRRTRLDMVSKGNLLGLVYTAYCSANLTLQ